MNIVFSPQALEDYKYWVATDVKIAERIRLLLKDASGTPFSGIGKPEALKANLQGFWSRRIDREHRLVYRVKGTGEGQTLEVVQCRFHY